MRLGAALRWYWFTRGRPGEARAWLAHALDQAADVEPGVRGRALDTAAALAHSQGAYTESRTLQEAGLAVWREVGDQRRQAAALSTLGIVAKAQGEHARAAELLESEVAQARQVGDAGVEATALNNLAALANDVGDYEQAREYLEQSLTIKRALFRQAGDGWGQALCIEGLAEAAAARGEHASSVRLFGAADGWRNAHGAPVPPNDRPAYDQALAAARAALGQASYAIAWDEGQAQALDI